MAAHEQLQIVQVSEIAEMLGVSRQRADELTRRKGFPEPETTVGGNRVWLAETIRSWQRMSDKGQAPAPCPTCGQAAWPRSGSSPVGTRPAKATKARKR